MVPLKYLTTTMLPWETPYPSDTGNVVMGFQEARITHLLFLTHILNQL